MPILTIFYIKLLINLGLTAGILWVIAKPHLFSKWQEENDKAVFTIAIVLLRLIPWIGIFIVLDQAPRGDVPFFFYKAEAAKNGGFVYRDFWSYHAPLFSYIISLPLWIWHNSRVIVLFMVAMESLILWLTYQTYKPRKTEALQLSVLYLLLPAAFMYILIDGQEEIWFWGAALLLWRFTLKRPENYETGLAILFSIALLTIKISFIFLLPAILILVQRPFRLILVMGAVGIFSVGFLYWQIGDLFLMPIRHTEQFMTPNLFSVGRPWIEIFVHVDQKQLTFVNWIGLIFTFFVPGYIAFKARRKPINEVLPALFIACFASMMLFQASAMGAYVIAYLMAVVFEVIDIRKKTDVAVVLLLNWLTVVQPFVWVYLGQPNYTSLSMFANYSFLFEYLLQLFNVLCLMWIIRRVYRKVQTNQTPLFL